jgi:hypothetical protein
MVRILSHFSYHSCPLTHSVFLVICKAPLKITTRKSQLSPNSMVNDQCSVLVTGFISWESRSKLLSRAEASGWGGFHEQREILFAHSSII